MKCGARDYPCMMWPLYLGPQQQLEPSGKGSGLWADPEPRVDVRDLVVDGGEHRHIISANAYAGRAF